MQSRFVIHAVGPIWGRASPEEDDATLASAYTESLRLAEDNSCVSVAFPNISTGVYRFPKLRAAKVATDAVSCSVRAGTSIEAITFVCFDRENLELYEALLS